MEEAPKVTISETKWANETILYNDQEISVNPHISLADEAHLTLLYIALYFVPNKEENSWNITLSSLANSDAWGAEFGLKREILKTMTNIDMSNEERMNELVFELFDIVSPHIRNYNSFIGRLHTITNNARENIALNKSVGSVIDNLSNKVLEVLESLKSINPEEMKQLGSTLLNQMSESPVAEIFKESAKTPRVKKEKVAKKE